MELPEDFYKIAEETSFKKNEYILREGQVSKKVYFIKKGVIRHYLTDIKGKVHTLNISEENEFFFSGFASYQTGLPSEVNCQKLTARV